MLLSSVWLHAQDVNNLNQSTNHGTDIQAAIDNANPGDVIELSNGTYTISNTIDVDKSLTIQGVSEAGVILDASGMMPVSQRVIETDADNITLRNFTIIPVTDPNPGPMNGGDVGFTIKAGANSGLTINSGLVLENITINGAERTPFDVHGVDDATLTNLTANNTTNGNGINITGGSNIFISGFTGANNAWGSIGIFASRFVNRPSSNVTIDGPTLAIDRPVYNQDDLNNFEGPDYVNTDIVVLDWCFTVTNPDFSPFGDSEEYTYYVPDEDSANNLADQLDDQMGTSSSVITPTEFGSCTLPAPLPIMGNTGKAALMLMLLGFCVFFGYRRLLMTPSLG